MEGAIVALIVVVVALAGLVVFLLLRSLGRPVSRPHPGTNPQPIDPAALRRERLGAAQSRAVEAESQAAYEDTLLILEEDTEYYRQQTKETREARYQRRKRPKDQQKT